MEWHQAEITPPTRSRSRYIQYNRERDLPLMLAIRNATFISHCQLWEHVQANGIETSRRSFNWRIARLTQAGVIEKLPPLLPYPGLVYSVVSMSSDCALKEEIPRDIEVAIIGQTVDELSASRIVERLRTTQPRLRILRLAEPNASIGYEYDCVCLVEDGPGVLLGCLAELVANAETVGSEPISTRHILTRQRDYECD
jgi:hypothetical protein